MDSDDIYKAIGYTVAVMFFIYIIVRVLNLQFDIVSGIKKKVDEGFKEGRKDEDDEDDEDDGKKNKDKEKKERKTSESQQTKIDQYLDGIEKRNDKKDAAIGFAKNQSKFKAALAEEMNGCEYDIISILIQTGKKGELTEEAQKKISALKIKLEACQAVHQGI